MEKSFAHATIVIGMKWQLQLDCLSVDLSNLLDHVVCLIGHVALFRMLATTTR